MPRYSSKTYSKKRETSESKKFDELFNNYKPSNCGRVTRSSPVKPSTVAAAGPSRTTTTTQKPAPAPSHGSSFDPFDFDSDEDKKLSPKKAKLSRNNSSSAPETQPAAGTVSLKAASSSTSANTNTNRSSRAIARISTWPTGGGAKLKQSSIDRFASKLSPAQNPPQPQPTKPVKITVGSLNTDSDSCTDYSTFSDHDYTQTSGSATSPPSAFSPNLNKASGGRAAAVTSNSSSSSSQSPRSNFSSLSPSSLSSRKEANSTSHHNTEWATTTTKVGGGGSRPLAADQPDQEQSPSKFMHCYPKNWGEITVHPAVNVYDYPSSSDDSDNDLQFKHRSTSNLKTYSSPASKRKLVQNTAGEAAGPKGVQAEQALSRGKRAAVAMAAGARPQGASDIIKTDIIPKKDKPKFRMDSEGSQPKKIFSSQKKRLMDRVTYKVKMWEHTEESEATTEESQQQTESQQSTSTACTGRLALVATDSYDFGDDEDESDSDIYGVLPVATSMPPPRLVRTVSSSANPFKDSVTSIKCNKEVKQLYTVVRNVKQAHQVQESGESQQFLDDIEFLLDGLEDSGSLATRCLSAASLADKCAIAAFRTHLRAHDTVPKIFAALHDAATDPSLALCTAAIMFMLGRDRLNINLDKEAVALMVQLLSVDTKISLEKLHASRSKEYVKTKEKIQATLRKLPISFTKNLIIDNISVGYLTAESLFSLTSRKSEYKEELRNVGGLDHIVQTVGEHMEAWEENGDEMGADMTEKTKLMEMFLRILENVTFMNTNNQAYLVRYRDYSLIRVLVRSLKLSESCVQFHSEEELSLGQAEEEEGESENGGGGGGRVTPGYVAKCYMLATLRVLLNLTHDNEWGSNKVGEQEGLIATALRCVLQSPQFIPDDQRFDLLVLGLGLLINLVEHSKRNREVLVNTRTGLSFDSQSHSQQQTPSSTVEVLVQLYLQRESAVKQAEAHTDESADDLSKSGEWVESEEGMEWVAYDNKMDNTPDLNDSQQVKKSLNQALNKAGKHMEDSIVASYVALLLGCLVQDNAQNAVEVRRHLPDGNFGIMIATLAKFLEFMDLTNAAGSKGVKSISKVIEVLEACDQQTH